MQAERVDSYKHPMLTSCNKGHTPRNLAMHLTRSRRFHYIIPILPIQSGITAGVWNSWQSVQGSKSQITWNAGPTPSSQSSAAESNLIAEERGHPTPQTSAMMNHPPLAQLPGAIHSITSQLSDNKVQLRKTCSFLNSTASSRPWVPVLLSSTKRQEQAKYPFFSY